MFTSRSAVETYQDCPRMRYNQYFLNGKGVVRAQKSVPLVTGSAVHRGVEHLLSRVRIGETPDIDTAVQLAVTEYVNEVEGKGFSGKGLQSDKQQWFTFNEQKALLEGLIRAWGLKELPLIVDRYKVLAVERDIEPITIAPEVEFQAKVDAELQEIKTGDYFNYSLKTAASWGERNENSYKSDLQGVTEIWAVEEDARREKRRLDTVINTLNKWNKNKPYPLKQVEDINKWVGSKIVDKKISGIRFCYLIKGIWKMNDFAELKVTYSPLIRAYKNITPGGVAYAHSWSYPNSANKSGKSVLGQGWTPFNVWEDMGVKKWVEMLESGEIQPDCGDIVKQQVVTPLEYMRYERDVEGGMLEVKLQEKRVEEVIGLLGYYEKGNDSIADGEQITKIMAQEFNHNRKHCYFHFGGECEYLPLCWEGADSKGELYEIRVPHHLAEQESI